MAESRIHLTQSDAGCVRRPHAGQQKMIDAANELEGKYRSGTITAEELLKEMAVRTTNLRFREMLLAAAVREAEADEEAEGGNQPRITDPVLDLTEDMLSDESEEEVVDSDEEQEAEEARQRSHQWRLVDWPEASPLADGGERMQLNRLRPEEDLDTAVVSVCVVCAEHYDYHYVLVNCAHQVCRDCLGKISLCPECREPRGPIQHAKQVCNKPSLIRADSEGRPENRIISQRANITTKNSSEDI